MAYTRRCNNTFGDLTDEWQVIEEYKGTKLSGKILKKDPKLLHYCFTWNIDFIILKIVLTSLANDIDLYDK